MGQGGPLTALTLAGMSGTTGRFHLPRRRVLPPCLRRSSSGWTIGPAVVVLLVTFTTGRRHLYSKVPHDPVERFRRATSKGRYFNAHIRDRYAYRELEPSLD